MKKETGKLQDDIILLAHGGGGLRSKQLIRDVILSALENPILAQLDDGACISIPESELVFTTDSYVVTPIFFPGGDIGKLAACGTINDLAMQGAEPRYLSLSLIIEEGFHMRDMKRIVESLAKITRQTSVQVVTGDTKVVERGKGNDIFINTAGIGVRNPGTNVHISNARNGDVVMITGTIGDHGIAVMSKREKALQLKTSLLSDVAPLWDMIEPLIMAVPDIHCLRDPTRGGVATALCEIADTSGKGVRIQETALPIKKDVQAVCNLLGLDPLNVANEGKALVICAQADADRALRVLRSHSLGKETAIIGTVVSQPAGTVLLETKLGGERIIETPMGENLPRIC